MITPQDLAAAKLALGERLAALRRAAGRTQSELANLVITSRSTVANVERGRQLGTCDFWRRSDEATNAEGALLREYEQVRGLQRRHYREAANLVSPRWLSGIGEAFCGQSAGSEPEPGLPVWAQSHGSIPDDCRCGWRRGDGRSEVIADRTETSGDRDARSRAVVHAQIPAIQCALNVHDIPPDGPVRPLPALRDDVARAVRMRLQSHYQRLATDLPHLLTDLHRAFQAHVGQRRATVARLLVQAYRAADAVADKNGYYDLSARIIGLMLAAARESGDELTLAAGAYVRAETFFANGQFEAGRTMLERAADRLMPESGTGAAAGYGALHMRAAVLAARAGRLGWARDHLAEARSWAYGLPEGVYSGTVFGLASVQIHEVTLTVDSGDPGLALDLAARWEPPADLPAERRSHFYIDVARAYTSTGAGDLSLESLLAARTIAPEHVRDHPQVRGVLGELAQGAMGRDDRLQEYLRWVGEPAIVNRHSGEEGQEARSRS